MPVPSIALQLYTVRDALQSPDTFEQRLSEIAQMGYEYVELAGLYGKTPEELESSLRSHGLKAISTHEGLDLVEQDVKAAIARARTFGYDTIAIPWIGEEHRTPEGFRALSARLRPVADALAADGITLLWHNHNFEYLKLPNGEMPIDILAASGVRLEMDVYWVCHAEQSPLDWLVKYSGRVPILHMKDMQKDRKDFAEVGTGVLDLPLYAREAAGHGVRYLVVEQDSNWAVSPMESARVGIRNLKKMLANCE
jgi:sugar phosphate isomerase/epimerase